MTTVYFLYRKLQLTLVLYTFAALMTSCNTRTSDEIMRSNYPEWRSFGSKPVYHYLIYVPVTCHVHRFEVWLLVLSGFVEHFNLNFFMLFLENVNHYYGYVLNPMLMVGGVIRSEYWDHYFSSFISYTAFQSLLFPMFVLCIEISNSTTIVSYYKRT